MTTNQLCPYCDNLPPYYLATITVTKSVSMAKIVELTDKVAELEREVRKLTHQLHPKY